MRALATTGVRLSRTIRMTEGGEELRLFGLGPGTQGRETTT
jgi:hypothetical protein